MESKKYTVLITGASSGIGACTARILLKQGHKVIGLSRRVNKDLNIPYYACDLSNHEQVVEVVNKIKEEHSDINCLINCAGMGVSGALEYHSYDEVVKNFMVNVIGLMDFTKYLIPLLRDNKPAKIINVSSVAAEITIPFQTVYSMTKRAILGYSEGLKMELKPFGIDVSSVLPGDTKTEFTSNRVPPMIEEDDVYKDRIKRSIAKMAHDEQNGVPASKVSKVIISLMNKKKMPVQRTVGFDYRVLVWLSRKLPKWLVSKLVYSMYSK